MPEHYLGIDVGFSESRRSTGLCLLTLDQTSLRWSNRHNTGAGEAERRKALQSLVPESTSVDGVGIDGPLARDIKIVKRYRSADALLSRGPFQKRCKPGQTNSGTGKCLHEHATKLAKLVLSLRDEKYLDLHDATHPDPIHEARILEVFPTAFLAVLLSEKDFSELQTPIPRGKRTDILWDKAIEKRYLERLIKTLAPQKRLKKALVSIRNHDHRAAFVCALAALCVAKNQYVAVGDPEDGYIILPPNLQPWAEDALRKNVGSVGKLNKYPNHDKAQVIQNGNLWS